MLKNNKYLFGMNDFILIVFLSFAFIVLDPIVRFYTLAIPDNINFIFQYITRLGDAIYAVPLVSFILLGNYCYYNRARLHIFSGFCNTVVTMIIGSVFINIGKTIIGRARPKLFQELGAYYFKPFSFNYDYLSFPSGHTMTWGLLALSMAVIFPKHRFLWYFSIILVGLSRVILGAHYISDVFFSVLLSYIIVYYCHNYLHIPFIVSLKQRLKL